jgi:hypothetical protein
MASFNVCTMFLASSTELFPGLGHFLIGCELTAVRFRFRKLDIVELFGRQRIADHSSQY